MGQSVRQLWGQEFPVVPQGLSESAVVAFVNKLMEEREVLAKYQESSAHLRQLAEKMVLEAGVMANTMRKQAETEAEELKETARSKANEIANETARIMSETIAKADDIMRKAQQEAETVRAETSREFEQQMGAIWGKFSQQMGMLEQRVVKELWDELNNQFQSLKALGSKYQGKWIDDMQEIMAKSPEPVGAAGDISVDTVENSAAVPVQCDERGNNVVLSPEAHLSTNVVDTQESPSTPESEHYQGEVEILVAQPVNASKLLKLTVELERTPGIVLRNVVNSSGGPCIISVLLKKPVALVPVLKSIGGVRICDTWDDGMPTGEAKRLNIELAR